MATLPMIDIGILTIRDDEFRAVLDVFPDDHAIHRGRHREYTLRRADAGGGMRYQLALLRQIEQGNGEAQEAARDLIDDLQPSLLLVVGIAGGLPSDDITLGDVVLSTRILDFSIEARKFGEATTYSVGGGPVAKAIATGVANLSGREAELGKWWATLPKKPLVALSAKNFYGPIRWQREVRQKVQFHYGPGSTARPPVYSAGTIASSDRLVKDPRVLFPWVNTARTIQAIEMESAGVHRATRSTPMLAIRGLSDIVGFKRSDGWTRYACASAAAFARAYLRTRPVEVRSPTEPTGDKGSVALTPVPEEEDGGGEAYATLLPLSSFPERLFVAPAKCTSMKDGWRQLLEQDNKKKKNNKTAGPYIPKAWFLFEGNVYTLADPDKSPIGKIVELGTVEVHETKDWAFSQSAEQRRLFVYLMNSALRDDLWSHGVRFHPDADVFAFIGFPDEPPKKFKYQNLKLRSTVTVVSHYERSSKKGKTYRYLRHVAFQGRFRFLGGSWYLEITPTYRFTNDGKKQHWFHEDLLSGIKRLEKNRSVLSQLLLWQAVIRAPWTRSDRQRMLEFGPLPTFDYKPAMEEAELTALDVPPPKPVIDREIDV